MPLLTLRHIRKEYATPVLQDVDLNVSAGRVHALVGANGAGKSTLARIIAGITLPTEGAMHLDGEDYQPPSRRDAESRGVYLVLQELNLIPTLSVSENVFFNRMPHTGGFVRFGEMRSAAAKALDTIGLADVDPDTRVSKLGVGQQQLVEIATVLDRSCRILILDEPTAALTDPEIDRLFDRISELRDRGVGIIYVSHRMEEIRRIADVVTVLRDGLHVATRPMSELSMPDIVRLMVGRDVDDTKIYRPRALGEPALAVEGISRGGKVRDVSFEVRRGEIFGLAGLVGSGRTETLRAVFGADVPDAGAVFVGPERRQLRRSRPAEAVRAGLGLVPEDRKGQGLLLPLSLRINATLAALRRAVSRVWIRGGREAAIAENLRDMLHIQSHGIDQPVRELSGGNQQKVVISRWLLRDCRVLLLDEPTRGVDVAARFAIYELLMKLAREGKAMVVASSEPQELMAICDRIGVMSEGRLVETFARGSWSQDALMEAALRGRTSATA